MCFLSTLCLHKQMQTYKDGNATVFIPKITHATAGMGDSSCDAG